MLLNIVYIVLGIVMVLVGANCLTDGAVSIARRFRVPQIVIGLTIVAMGTSMPEFFVSFTSALKGTTGLAVGNVVGSNIFNAMLIVGVAAMIAPIQLQTSTVKLDLPVNLGASLLVTAFAVLLGGVSRLAALVLVVCFVSYMAYTLRSARKDKAEEEKGTEKKPKEMWLSIALVLTGLTMLVFGSNIFVEGAQSVAEALGVSEAVIGLTIVAGGTSLPELATSSVAAARGNSGIAIGNVLGSNVFNILAILGVTGLIQPLHIVGLTSLDFGMMTLSAVLLWLFSYTKFRIEHWEGCALTLIFLGYMTYLVVNV